MTYMVVKHGDCVFTPGDMALMLEFLSNVSSPDLFSESFWNSFLLLH